MWRRLRITMDDELNHIGLAEEVSNPRPPPPRRLLAQGVPDRHTICKSDLAVSTNHICAPPTSSKASAVPRQQSPALMTRMMPPATRTAPSGDTLTVRKLVHSSCLLPPASTTSSCPLQPTCDGVRPGPSLWLAGYSLTSSSTSLNSAKCSTSCSLSSSSYPETRILSGRLSTHWPPGLRVKPRPCPPRPCMDQ